MGHPPFVTGRERQVRLNHLPGVQWRIKEGRQGAHQVPPLRFAPVGMTKWGFALPGNDVADWMGRPTFSRPYGTQFGEHLPSSKLQFSHFSTPSSHGVSRR